MRVFVTGGTGFIGGRLVRKLRERGDDVVVLVRSPENASTLDELGCKLLKGDLGRLSIDTIRQGISGCDAVYHVAAVYKVGIPKSERAAMHDSNVNGTERVLKTAYGARVKRIVYVSTVGVFGNTHGEIVDETYQRPAPDFLSYYEETKYLSHQVALKEISRGSPIVIVQPGGVYGPGDHSEIGNFIDQTRNGKLRMLMFPELGFNLVYVDDVAEGIVLAHDKGEPGESYVLGGEISTMRKLIEKVAQLSDQKAPKREMPVAVMKLARPIGPVVGKLMGFPPNLGELIRSSDGVTYWASHEKAREQLGYSPRDLETGLRETLAAT